MRVRDEVPEDPSVPYLVKKPTEWMTNCKWLADLLSVRCDGNHTHVKLEGGSLTKKAQSYPPALVSEILKTVGNLKRVVRNANRPRDPLHTTFPEDLQPYESMLGITYSQNTLTAFDINPPGIQWSEVVLRRTINRKTGVIMAEDYT